MASKTSSESLLRWPLFRHHEDNSVLMLRVLVEHNGIGLQHYGLDPSSDLRFVELPREGLSCVIFWGKIVISWEVNLPIAKLLVWYSWSSQNLFSRLVSWFFYRFRIFWDCDLRSQVFFRGGSVYFLYSETPLLSSAPFGSLSAMRIWPFVSKWWFLPTCSPIAILISGT